jgi:predicted DNA-binding transcriptional regulator AlpA
MKQATPRITPEAARQILLAALGVHLPEPAPEPEPPKPEPDEPESRQIPKLAYMIDEFCKAHGIGRSTFYCLMDRGEGPDMMRVGDTHRISAEAAKRWRREREAASRGRRSGSGAVA